MIPKIIHYCWFGGGALPEKVEMCIDSWKKHCPDYTIIRWDESNYDYTKNKYMLQAYEAKKWGFVPDYARLDIIYNHGGIYLDTDVELIKPIDGLLGNKVFLGMEDTKTVNFGLGFGAECNNAIIGDVMYFYNNLSFYKEDGELNLIPSPHYQTAVLKKYGFQEKCEIQKYGDLVIYPPEFFCPKNFETGKMVITENTISIHHFDNSWSDEREKTAQNIRWKLSRYFPSIRMKYIALLIATLKCEGIKKTISRVIQKAKRNNNEMQ